MHSHDDELLVLAEALGEVKTKTEKLEAEFSTQARPLEAATNALSATLSGIKALQFHVIDNNLGALSARVEEMRKAVDEQVGVIALELKKADESNAAKAGQEADALRSEIAGLQAQLGTLGAQFEAQLARVEFAAKEEAKKLQLIPGPAGEAGASLNPRGTFIDGQTYNRLDVVSWLGSSYIATVDGVTEKPSKTSTQWQVLASRGNGGGGTASLNDMLGAPSAGTIVGSEGSSYVRKTLVAGANIAISETPSTITITGTEGEISLEDGSAASPSLFFTNDPDTGIYRPGSNQVGISLGGSAQAVLTSTTFTVTPNLVVSGTGTSSIGGNATVAGTLTVSGTGLSAFAGNVETVGAAASDRFFQTIASGTLATAIGQNTSGSTNAFGIASGNSYVGNAQNYGLAFSTNAVTRMTISNGSTGGNVSISSTTASTSTSTGALVVSGGVGVAGALYVGSKGQFQSNDDALSLKYSTDGGSCLLAWKNTSGTTLWSIGGGIDTRQDELVFRRGSTTVLNLNNSNNATFAGTLTVSSSGVSQINGTLLVGAQAASGASLDVQTASGTASTLRLFQQGVSNWVWSVPASTDALVLSQYGTTEAMRFNSSRNALFASTTASTSTSTGALVVSGGVGVAGNLNIGGELQISSAYPAFKLTDTNSNSDFTILNDNGRLAVYDETNAAYRLTIGATGGVKIGTTPEDVGANNLTVQGTLAVSGNTNTFGAGGTGGANSQLILEGGSAANGGGAILYRKNGTVKAYAGMESSILGGGSTSDNYIIYTSSGLALTVAGQQVQANATTASTSTSTGALVVSGGVGVAKEVYVGKTCKVGTGSDNEGYTNVFTNKAENTAGPFDITLPSDCVGVVFLNSYQSGVGRSFREIPFICFGGTVTLGTSRTTVLTADPVTSVAAAASSKITISLYAGNTNCYWGIYVNKS